MILIFFLFYFSATQLCLTKGKPEGSSEKVIEAIKFGCFPVGGTNHLKLSCAAEGTNVLIEMYTDDKCTKVATGDSKMTVVLTEKDVTETQVQDGQTVTVVKTYESVTSTCNGGVAGAEIVSTGAACSTIAATAGFCGGQMYDSGKATHTCAGTPCAAHAASDTAACCKTDTRASCSTIAASTDFCGEGKIYNDDNAANKCAGETCSKTTDIGTGSHATIGECCKTDDKCATTDGSVVPWGAKTLNYEQCACGNNENTKGCSEGSTCDIKAVVPCTCTPR